MKNSTKKLAFSALALSLATGAFAQTPKSCDLEITLVSPSGVINFGDQITISFNIKNNGPAAITATDTIYYRIPVGGTQANPGTISFHTGVAIASGASTTATYSGGTITNNNTTGTDQVTDFCVQLLDQTTITNNGAAVTVTYNDPTATNNESCKNVTLKTQTSSIFDTKTVKETLSLFPNPATSKVSFSIALDKAETVSAVVRDLTGREVMTQNFGQIQSGTSATLELNVTNLNSGIYLVEVVAGDKKFIGKVTKKD